MKTMILKPMAKLFTITFLCAIFSAAFAQENIVEQTRSLEPFSGIETRNTSRITIEQGDVHSVVINADSEYIQDVKTELKNNILILDVPVKPASISVHVVFKDINSLKASSSSRILGKSKISTENLSVFADGASNINVELEVNELITNASGASSVSYKGKTANHKIVLNGASRINAFNLETENSHVELSGAGVVNINATKLLKGTISGLGNIFYTEEPESIMIETSGLGVARKKTTAAKDVDTPDTTRFKLGTSQVIILSDRDEKKEQKNTRKNKKFDGHWGGVEIGINGLLDKNNKLNLPNGYEFLDLNLNKSIAVNLNIIEESINLYKNKVGIVTGLGFTFNSYQFSKNINLLPAQPNVMAVDDTVKDYLKNRLKVTYITLPLLIEAQAGKTSKFHFSGGVVFGLKINAYTKQVYEIAGSKYKDKINDDYNLNPFKADLSVRAGWGIVNLFANYSLTPLFKSSKQPELYPFTVGIRLVGW